MELPGHHVLAFDPAGPASGWLQRDRWFVAAAGASPQDLGLAALHELAHRLLNDSTAWGALLRACALVRGAQEDSRHRRNLQFVVSVCRRTHEAYAVQASLRSAIRRDREPSESLRDHPDYVTYLETALALAPADGDRETRPLAVSTALSACMESPALSTYVEVPSERFVPADVPRREWPDRRLQVLRRSGPELWRGMTWSGGDVAERCTQRVADVLAEAGLGMLPRSDYLDALGRLARRHPASGESAAVDTDSWLGIPAAHAGETLVLRSPRRALVLDQASAPGEALVRRGRSGPHLYLIVRRPSHLRAQYRLDAEPPRTAGDAPVVLLTAPAPDQDAVLLVPIARPETLTQLGAEVPILASVSAHCATDAEWGSAWLTVIESATRSSFRLDLRFDVLVQTWLRSRTPFECALISPGGAHDDRLLLWVSVAGEAPLLLPLTLAAAASWRMYLERATEGSVGLEPGPITPDLVDVADHLLTDESSFGFLDL